MKITYGQLKGMIAESVNRVLSEERYMSDADIAAKYSDMKIVDFVLERSDRFDGWTGRFEVEYPNADDVDFDSYIINNFIVYDLDGNRIGWDNWMPEGPTKYLEGIIRKEIAKRKGGVVESKLNEIGDTPMGDYMLGRLDMRNEMDKEQNPDGKHATYRNNAYWKAKENGGGNTDNFSLGMHNQKLGDKRKIKHDYDSIKMDYLDKLGERFVGFFSKNDKMLQLISEYETEGKDAFEELMDAFEEKLGYTLTDKSRRACKKAYNMWWYYNGQYVLSGMEESKVRQIAVGKMTSVIMESVKKRLTERYRGPKMEYGRADIGDKVFDVLFDKFHDDEVMDGYVEDISDIDMIITATIIDTSEPEVGYNGYEITDVDGDEDIKQQIKSKGLPENVTKIFCDIVDGVVENLEYDDFATSEIEPDSEW